MVDISAPYKRRYDHTKSRGNESSVNCEFCGKKVPRFKAFPIERSFRLPKDIMQAVDKRFMSSFSRKAYVCPSCARFRGIVMPGKYRKSRTGANR